MGPNMIGGMGSAASAAAGFAEPQKRNLLPEQSV